MARDYVTIEVSLDDFDDDAIIEAAKQLGLTPEPGEDLKTLANAAYVAIICNKPDDEKAIARKLIGEILGRVI